MKNTFDRFCFTILRVTFKSEINMDFDKNVRTAGRCGIFLGVLGLYLSSKNYMPEYMNLVSIGMTTFGVAVALLPFLLRDDQDTKEKPEGEMTRNDKNIRLQLVEAIKPLLEEQFSSQTQMRKELEEMKRLLSRKEDYELKQYFQRNSDPLLYREALKSVGTSQLDQEAFSFDLSVEQLKVRQELDLIKNMLFVNNERWKETIRSLRDDGPPKMRPDIRNFFTNEIAVAVPVSQHQETASGSATSQKSLKGDQVVPVLEHQQTASGSVTSEESFKEDQVEPVSYSVRKLQHQKTASGSATSHKLFKGDQVVPTMEHPAATCLAPSQELCKEDVKQSDNIECQRGLSDILKGGK